MKSKFSNTSRMRQLGQGMTEYIIIVALIAVSAIGVFRLFGDTLRHQVAGLSQELSGSSGSTEQGLAKGSADDATAKAATQKDLSNYHADNQSTGDGN